MGIKSTTFLTRKEAEDKYVDLYNQRKERKARSKAAKLTDKELENKLEEWNDDTYGPGQTGFDNYMITETGERM